MWNSIDEWFSAIETVDPKDDSEEIFKKTMVACHAGARIYDTDIQKLIQSFETDSATFKIPLVRVKLPEKYVNKSIHSAADLLKNKFGSPQERELYAIYSFADQKVINNTICNAYVAFMIWGLNVNTPTAKDIPRINALADFGRYLQKKNIKAYIYSTKDNGFWTDSNTRTKPL